MKTLIALLFSLVVAFSFSNVAFAQDHPKPDDHKTACEKQCKDDKNKDDCMKKCEKEHHDKEKEKEKKSKK